jgi:hypothetical protein
MSPFVNNCTAEMQFMSQDEILTIYDDLRFHYNRYQSKYVQFHHAPDLETDILELDNILAQHMSLMFKVSRILSVKFGINKLGTTSMLATKIKYPRL